MTQPKRVLISTIKPAGGGVPAMVRAVVDYLGQREYKVTLAYYEPYSVSPDCSVPLHSLLFKKPSIRRSEYYGCQCLGIGCYLPELEFTHYLSTAHWRALIEQHDVHLAISGSSLAALPFVQTSTPFLAWIASDWQGDRVDRVKTFPWYRRLIDQTLITFISKRLEKKVIASGDVVALSEHTQIMLNDRVGNSVVQNILSMPIDTGRFKPLSTTYESTMSESITSESTIAQSMTGSPRKIGFVGRFEDPRKNVALLLSAFSELLESREELELLLIGDKLSAQSEALAKDLSVFDNIRVYPYLGGDELLERVCSLDVFVLPSHQEGLCIAALESMSCGVPVVSTRCGGPESFIIDGENGVLVESNSTDMASAIVQLLSDEDLRLRYAKRARETVIDRFSKHALADDFWALFDQRFEQS